MIPERSFNHGLASLRRMFAALPAYTPSEWVEKNFKLNEESFKGDFDFCGREYLRRVIDDNGDFDCKQQTLISGTGAGKTISFQAGVFWKFQHEPCRGLWVMPATNGEGGSRTLATSRLIPNLRATPALARYIPESAFAERGSLNGSKIRINGGHLGLVGANSSSQIASNRVGDIRLDEVDKYKGQLGNEAGTMSLVKERVEGVAVYQIFIATTPTLDTGIGWQSLLHSNFQVYMLPCPHCNAAVGGKGDGHPWPLVSSSKGWFLLAWSEQYAVGLPDKTEWGDTIPHAYIVRDKECERKDGTWDKDRVFSSSRVRCPHCGGDVTDKQKVWMDKHGVWCPTKHGDPKHRGYHVSSLYAPLTNDVSTFGGRSLKFVNSFDDSEGEGIRGFVNSTLSLPYMTQEQGRAQGLEISLVDTPILGSVKRVPILSCDVQQLWPFRWWTCREWVASVLRPERTDAQQKEFESKLGEERRLAVHIPVVILRQMQRTDQWPALADWVVKQGIVGENVTAWLQSEFQADLLRMLEFIARKIPLAFERQGDSRLLEAGFGDTFEDLEAAQLRHAVYNGHVIVDAGFGAREDANVYAECYQRCPRQGFTWYHDLLKKHYKTPFPGSKPFAAMSWLPCKGFDREKRWRDHRGIGLPWAMLVDDPFKGKENAGQTYHYVFNFSAQYFLDELDRLRKKHKWEISPRVRWWPGEQDQAGGVMNLATYNKHLSNMFKNPKTGLWEKRGGLGGNRKRHPDHLFDCEKNGLALATYIGIFKHEKQIK